MSLWPYRWGHPALTLFVVPSGIIIGAIARRAFDAPLWLAACAGLATSLLLIAMQMRGISKNRPPA